MFNNDHLSDVRFAVQKANGETGIISAHKFVLSISSRVFENMFYGENSEAVDVDSVELRDCDNESFLELLRFCYSDEVKLNARNVMRVSILAKRFLLPSLADKCSRFISDNLDASNVFNILPLAVEHKEQDLVERCWDVIDKQTAKALESDGFVEIERPLLEAVVERDSLKIREIELFAAVNHWATSESERQGLTANGENKRKILGGRVLKAIRFSVMTEYEFTTKIRGSEILTKTYEEEVLNFVRHIRFASSSQRALLDERQSISLGNLQRLCRFASANGVWKYNGIAKDSIILSVDSDIFLRGLCLFGSANSSYSVALEVNEVDSYSALGCNIHGRRNRTQGQYSVVSVAKRHGTFPSLRKMGNYYVVELLFDFGIILKKNAFYCLEAVISGPSSLRGEGGSRVIQCLGAKFTFRDSYKDKNGTRVTSGQFPELQFYLMPPVHTKEVPFATRKFTEN